MGDSKIVRTVRRRNGYIIGMLPIMTATKVSRTAHEPACCAPPMGSRRINTQRNIPAIITKIPLRNMKIRRALRRTLRRVRQRIWCENMVLACEKDAEMGMCELTGRGMDIRYMSVATLRTTVT